MTPTLITKVRCWLCYEIIQPILGDCGCWRCPKCNAHVEVYNP